MRRWLLIVSLATAIAMLGCDGGGGGDDTEEGSGEIDTLLSLSASNAEDVSTEVVDSFGVSFALPVLSLGLNPVNPTLFFATFPVDDGSLFVSSGELPVSSGLMAASALDPSRLSIPASIGPVPLRQVATESVLLAVRVAVSETLACPGGGNVQFSGDITSPDRLTVGDTMTAVYTACMLSEVDGPVNGEITSTITEVGGDGTLRTVPYAFMVATQFRALSITLSDEGTVSLSGDVAWRENTEDGLIIQDRVTSQSLTGSLTGAPDPEDDGAFTLSSYTTSITVNIANPDLIQYWIDGSGGVESSGIAGKVTFDVIRDLTGFLRLTMVGYPEDGVVLINGGNGSTVTLTVLSDSQIQIDVDENGDGVSDATLVRSWTDLFPEGLL